MRFSQKTIIFIIIPALFPVIMTTLAYFFLLEPSIESTIENGINNISISLGDELNQVVNESVTNTNLLAQNPLIINDQSDNKIYEEELSKTRDFHQIFKDISLIDKDGNILVC